jgi:hypothetical protein
MAQLFAPQFSTDIFLESLRKKKLVNISNNFIIAQNEI